MELSSITFCPYCAHINKVTACIPEGSQTIFCEICNQPYIVNHTITMEVEEVKIKGYKVKSYDELVQGVNKKSEKKESSERWQLKRSNETAEQKAL